MDVNFVAAARDVFAGRAHVIFHVAGAENAARIDIFKAGEDFFEDPLGDMRDYVEAAAMAHAHDEFRGAEPRAGIEKFIDQRDQRGNAFEREAFAAKVTLLHNLLEDIGADEQVENARLVFFCDLETLSRRFHLLVNPAAAFGRVDVVDFDADRRGVNGAGFARVFAFDLQFWSGDAAEESRGDRDRLRDIPIGERR